jgi:prophage DNA circulation protein
MGNLTSQLVQLSFEGIPFPYKEITMAGEMRHHVHEYPHSPGGAPEKLGRKLYAFNITTPVHGDLLPTQYANLWPRDLKQLVILFEQGKTGNLVLPQIGVPIRAYCTNWDRTLRASNTSGESVTLKFLEDSEDLRISQNAVSVKANRLEDARFAVIDKSQNIKPKIGLLDTILRGVNDVLAYKDQFDLYTNLIEAKCNSVLSMLRQIIAVEEELKHPDRWPLVDALQELWAQTQALYLDQKQMGNLTRFYRVPVPMSLSQVSFQIYKTSARASDLMMLNSIDDPLEIKQGTNLRYYADAA